MNEIAPVSDTGSFQNSPGIHSSGTTAGRILPCLEKIQGFLLRSDFLVKAGGICKKIVLIFPVGREKG